MTVREAIGRAELGSPATLHKRLVRLRQAELIAVEFIAGDRRSKLLVPTEKGWTMSAITAASWRS